MSKKIKLSDEENELIQKYKSGYRGVYWHIDDFEAQAKTIEEMHQKKYNLELYPLMYDRSKFEDALYNMINKHDASLGINWTTIEVYLDTYCTLEDN